MEQLQSHICLTVSEYMVQYLRISSYIRKPFLTYDFETAPFRISSEANRRTERGRFRGGQLFMRGSREYQNLWI